MTERLPHAHAVAQVVWVACAVLALRWAAERQRGAGRARALLTLADAAGAGARGVDARARAVTAVNSGRRVEREEGMTLSSVGCGGTRAPTACHGHDMNARTSSPP